MSPEQRFLMLIVIASAGLVILMLFSVMALNRFRRSKEAEKNDGEVLNKNDYIVISADEFTLPKPDSLESNYKEIEKFVLERSQNEEAKEEILKVKPDAKVLEFPKRDAFVDKNLKESLKNTESHIFGRLRNLFQKSDVGSPLEDIEEVLYTSDLGPHTVQRLMAAIEEKLSRGEKRNYDVVKAALKEEIQHIFSEAAEQSDEIEGRMTWNQSGPTVLMIVGVNGAGKTTSIGKLAAYFAQRGKKVLVAAGDTFRAAAGSQLAVWTERAQVEIFSPPNVNDPSAVAFDALSKAKAQNYDLVILDTAGRLHTQANLMDELKKIKRVMAKVEETAPHNVWIVLDANSGQNALIQAKEFNQAVAVSGIVLTKMDGTAKGGVAVGVTAELKVPIKLIGVGEGIQDLRPFIAKEFVDSILS